MPTIRQILVPTDFSPCSVHALAEAQRFAGVFGAAIDVFHAWAEPTLVAPESVITGVGVDQQPLLEWIRRSAGKQLAQFEADAKSAGIPVRTTSCEPGDPATAIIERAANGGYDLLVLGTHGRTGLSHVLMGSVAENVVRRAPCPVLTVRHNE